MTAVLALGTDDGMQLDCAQHNSVPLDIFSFWSFYISDDILRNQKIIIGLDTFSNRHIIHLAPFG